MEIKDPKLQIQFVQQLKGIDFVQTNELFKHVYQESKLKKENVKINFEPVKNICSASNLEKNFDEFNQLGLETIAKG